MLVILTADEMLRKGLEHVGFDRARQQNVSKRTNIRRFMAHFGSSPVVYAQVWEDLQTTAILQARIDATKSDADSFLMAVHFLKCYPTEDELSGRFQICEKTARKWAWYFATKIQALKEQKVSPVLLVLATERESHAGVALC